MTDTIKSDDNETYVTHKNKSSQTLKRCLDMEGYQLRYDLRGRAVQVKHRDGDWAEIDDRHEAYIRELIASKHRVQTQRGTSPMTFGKDTWHDYVNAIVFQNEVDPFAEWLFSLKPWDQTERVDEFLITTLGATDNDLSRWASRLLFLGPIWRTHRPGYKIDEMPVLVGTQGIRKSSALRCVLPEDKDEWFSDQLNLADKSKERVEAMIGRVIVEVSEMGGSTKADLESLKAFITRQNDGTVRLAYERRPYKMLRRCILFGTADRQGSLPNDPAGLRRFCVIDCAGSDINEEIETYCNAVRNQLWAEALYYFSSGFRPNMPPSLYKMQREANEYHRHADTAFETAIRDKLSVEYRYTMDQIAQTLGIVSDIGRKHMTQQEQSRLSRALINSGWSSTRFYKDGKQVRGWIFNDN